MTNIGDLKKLDIDEYHTFIEKHAWLLKALITITAVGIELHENKPRKQKVTISTKGVKIEESD